MGSKRGNGDADRGRTYGFEVRWFDGAVDLVILVEEHARGGAQSSKEVWRANYETLEEAVRVRHVMLDMPWRWSTWVMLASIVEPEFLRTTILSDVDAFAKGTPAKNGSDCGQDGPVDHDIRFDLYVDTQPRIVGWQGGAAFIDIQFDTAARARRVWDWLRWQQHAFRSWSALARERGPIRLKRLIIEEMRLQEVASLRSGPPKDPRRPLRDWHP